MYEAAADALPTHFLKGDDDLTETQMRRVNELVAHFDKTVPSGALFDYIKKMLSPNALKKVSPTERRRLYEFFLYELFLNFLFVQVLLDFGFTFNDDLFL